ncbi:MAG TPA: SusC/RagA family TonB-linked outer membrane protein, partial [Prevotella sp.]|nr:SusC/RagA family TonB-linked outer membrane protein [Candidatus Segatella violae]
MGVPTEGWGYSTYTINNGEMYNRGVEISLNGEILRTKDFSWRANMTYAYNKNKVTYVNVKAPMYILQLDYPSAYPIIGNEYNAIYAYEWAGLSEEGLPQVYDENGEKVTNQPTTLDAIKYAGTTTPKYSGSFGTSVSYKDFDLSLQFLFAGGHKVRNSNPAFLTCSYSSIGYISNIAGASAGLADRWMQPGDEARTNVPKAIFAESGLSAEALYSTYYYADINVLDASYVRLNNISLAYHLPKSICRSLYLQNARIQANVENPFFWAKSTQAKYQLGGYNATNYVLGIYLNF